MSQTPIPFTPAYNTRGMVESALSQGRDARIKGGIYTVAIDPLAGTKTIYVNKRPGWSASTTPQAGSEGSVVFHSPSTGAVISAFGLVNSTIYSDTTNCGTITGVATHISEIVISGTTYYMITSWPGTGWFLASDSFSSTSFTANRTSGSTTLASVSSFTGLYVGQAISGTGIASGARIASLNSSASSLEMTLAATSGAATSTTITKTPVAKIIDADFPSDICGEFVELNGRVYIMTAETQRIYNSASNNPASWAAGDYITADNYSGFGVGLARNKNRIYAFCNRWAEVLVDNGNPSGSPLVKVDTLNVGAIKSLASIICTLGDHIYWASDDGLGVRVYSLGPEGVKPLTGAFEESIIASTSISYISAFYGFGGVNVVLDMAADSLMYQGSIGMWVEPNWTFNVRVSSAASGLGLTSIYAISSTATGGKVYTINNTLGDVYTDDGSAYDLVIQTEPKVLAGGNRIFVKLLTLIADNQSSGTVTVAASGDDGATFSNIGTFDVTSTSKRIWRCGSYRHSVAFKFTHPTAARFRAQAVLVDWDGGSH